MGYTEKKGETGGQKISKSKNNQERECKRSKWEKKEGQTGSEKQEETRRREEAN